MRRFAKQGLWVALTGLLVASVSALAAAEPYMALRINEVIADNKSEGPLDVGGSTTDMIEIYNTSSDEVVLGKVEESDCVVLTDEVLFEGDPPPDGRIVVPPPPATRLWFFRYFEGTETPPRPTFFDTIGPRGWLVVFCDENEGQNYCEPHASFQLASDGSEPVTLLGPVVAYEGGDLQKPIREIIDRVWLPPLPADVSFGRYPDGAGPAPVPLSQVLTTFSFHPDNTSSFGRCVDTPTECAAGKVRACTGAPNAPGGNIHPRLEIEYTDEITNSPAAEEPVKLLVKVRDEKEPVAPNITSVKAIYRVDRGADQEVLLAYDAQTGIQHTTIEWPSAGTTMQNPFNIYTYWKGEIPGQLAGAHVEFYLATYDVDGGYGTSPNTLCAEGVGPCDREFGGTLTGGTGCQKDLNDVTCRGEGTGLRGERYDACAKRFMYVSGHVPRAAFDKLVINEVVARQTKILADPTEKEVLKPCAVCGGAVTTNCCPSGSPNCCWYDDFIELYNGSNQTIDLSGLRLSNSRFHADEGWPFPPGSSIDAGEHLIVWTDSDGGKCPQPSADPKPCFWECPDPTYEIEKRFHTNFSLDASNDQIYLYDTPERNFGLLHGVAFTGLAEDHSLALIPDGDRLGCWIDTDAPTPEAPNAGSCAPQFLRADAKADCSVDITDAVFVLNYLFSGGPPPDCFDAADANDSQDIDITDAIFILGYLFLGSAPPPAPGPNVPGPDPTEDTLGSCDPPVCH